MGSPEATSDEHSAELQPLINRALEKGLGFTAYRADTESYFDDPSVRALFRNFPPPRSIAEMEIPEDN
jgi:hypothetical protein